jgi:DNA-binding XRE family transcriptional regulator
MLNNVIFDIISNVLFGIFKNNDYLCSIKNKSMEINKEEERRRIGRRIAEIRKDRQMTQSQLAELCGLQQAHIARIETGKYSVGLDTLALIASALNAKIDFYY